MRIARVGVAITLTAESGGATRAALLAMRERIAEPEVRIHSPPAASHANFSTPPRRAVGSNAQSARSRGYQTGSTGPPWEALVDFVVTVGSEYEKNLGCSLERSSEACQTFGLQRIHEEA